MPRLARRGLLAASVWLIVLPLGFPGEVRAHCDTLNGPVIEDARRALESGDLAPVLKWVAPADEPVLREAFATTSAVRKQGDQAKALADRYFFETLVRIHRAGEGASYEGLKPADSISPVVLEADRALASGSADTLVREISGSVADEVRKRFQTTVLRKAHAEESPEAGRAFVSAYVDYLHFVEGLHAYLGGESSPHESSSASHGH
jgi:hypothetical protein